MQYGRKGTSVVKTLSETEQSSGHAAKLAEGMAISDQAKKFVMAREIVKVKELQPHLIEGIMFILL